MGRSRCSHRPGHPLAAVTDACVLGMLLTKLP
jgi:hypothetical protein